MNVVQQCEYVHVPTYLQYVSVHSNLHHRHDFVTIIVCRMLVLLHV